MVPDGRPPAIADGQCVRLSCCVPFCRRTFRNDKSGTPWPKFSETMCGKHWRLINVGRRRRYKKLERMLRNRKGVLQGALADRIVGLLWAEWGRMKAAAIERAAGIA